MLFSRRRFGTASFAAGQLAPIQAAAKGYDAAPHVLKVIVTGGHPGPCRWSGLLTGAEPAGADQARVKTIAFRAFPILDPRPVFAPGEELFSGKGDGTCQCAANAAV